MRRFKGGMHQGASPNLFGKAKYLRYEKLTRHEQMLWEKIKKKQLLGQRFRRQHPIAHYILDFFCPSCRLCIEVDGCSHLLPVQIEYDENRTEYLKSISITVLRFTNEEVERDLDEVVEKIKRKIYELLG